MTNQAMPGLVKVGYSLKDPNLRAQEMNHTGTPHPYVVEYEELVEQPRDKEQLVHRNLNEFREGKEWFRCSVKYARSVIRQIIGDHMLLANEPTQLPKTEATTEPHAGSVLAAAAPVPKPRPVGTYRGVCWYCGNELLVTLNPSDTEVRCPECFRTNDVSGFVQRELFI